MSTLERSFDELGYDPDNLTTSTDMHEQFHEAMSKVILSSLLSKGSFDS